MFDFSICTSVYKNDSPHYLKEALDSLLVYQTIKPSQIILVQDGPISQDLSFFLEEYKERFGDIINILCLEKNAGLGNALKIGVENAKYDIIARMDSDDICSPDRFEKQLAYLEEHPECDIVGGQITEFIDNPDNVVGKRVVPCGNDAIYNFMRSRCALNHPTVMFRKKAVLDAGNYQDWFWNEDYYMWIRMMERGCVFANLPDVLVNMRSGPEQYGRRGGKKYFDSEIGIKKLMLQKGMITPKEYLINYIERFVIQLMLPNKLRGWVYRTFARRN